jgi:hypothetical protein
MIHTGDTNKYLHHISADVGILLEGPHQVIRGLAQGPTDFLDLLLHGLVLGLVDHALHAGALLDEALVALLQLRLLAHRAGDLLADKLGQLVAVLQNVRRYAANKETNIKYMNKLIHAKYKEHTEHRRTDWK